MSTRTRRGERMLPIKLAALSAMVAFLSMAFPNRAGAQCFAIQGPACVGPGCPGTLLTTYYQTTRPNGDNMIELVNPTGAGNPNPDTFCADLNVCAMIYVFDNNENLGECCGCQVNPQGLLSLSVEKNLTANWGLSEGAQSSGTIEIVSAQPGSNNTCNPGAGFSTTRQLNGSILRSEIVVSGSPLPNNQPAAGVAEVQFQDAGDIPATLQTNLATGCAAHQEKGASCTCAEHCRRFNRVADSKR
jgi:hypothetical protein